MNPIHHGNGTQKKTNIDYIIFYSISFVIFLTFALSPAEAVTLPKTSSIVPPETILLLDIGDFSQLKSQFEKTSLYKLYKDPAMTAFVEDFKTKLRKSLSDTDNNIIKAVVDQSILPHGRAFFALIVNQQATDTNEPVALFITQWGEAVSKIEEAVEKAAKQSVENGLHQKSEAYRGADIKTIIAEGNARLGYGFSSKLSYCFIDDCLIGSEDIEVLKFAIAHIKGATSPALAANSDYSGTMQTIGSGYDIELFVNIKQIVKTALSETTDPKAQQAVTALGFDNVAALGYAVGTARTAGDTFSGKAFLKIDGAKKGVVKILDFESSAVKNPKFIPASSYAISFLNLNFKNAYDEINKILYALNPAASAIMYTPLLPASPDGQPAVELKKDIIDNLGTQIIFAQSIEKPFSKYSAPSYLVALAVSNRGALEKSLALLHSKRLAPNNPDARRELLGYTIYVIDPSFLPFFTVGRRPMQMAGDSQTPPMPKLAFTITDTHLILGIESSVEQAIRTLSSGPSEAVGSARWYTTGKSVIPSVVGLAAMEDTSAVAEFFWWMMKEMSETIKPAGGSGEFPEPGEIAVAGPAAFSQFANFDLLPDFEVVKKYFGVSAFYGKSRPDGLFFEFKYLNPPGSD